MNYTIHRYATVDSTNNTAIRMAEEGAAEGTVVIAEEQTAGRGRRGRNWSSPPGDGLYLSLILRPGKSFDRLWQIAFVASLAAAESIARISDLPARIKWPNDVLINGRKVSGILVEAKSVSAGQSGPCYAARPKAADMQSPAVIVGIGVNVNTPHFPPELANRATSLLLESGSIRSIEISAVEDELLSAIRSRYDQYLDSGFFPILNVWRMIDCTVGRQVTVKTVDGTITGTAENIDDDGDLIIIRRDGSVSKLSSGEVILG